MNRSQFLDAAERVGATAAEAGIAAAVVEVQGLPGWWVPVLVPVLAALKSGLASFLGRKGTPSLLPAGADPASRR
ncbi:hypothetical protein AB0O31_03105 [Kitasatospora cineracea]|uniref:hypothetical protein n=1 Tax=Kitasatospora cineracea TaxID=88074 RepID=UPI00341210ED